MDATTLMLGIVFGSLGLGYLVYGRKESRILPIACGLMLLIVPYLIPNAIVMSAICVLLAIIPFVFPGI